MNTYTVITTLVYRVEADTEDEARDVVAHKTDNPADMEGVEFLTGDYLIMEEAE